MTTFEEDIQFIYNAMKRVSSKWTTQIVFTIMENKVLRFKDLEKKVEGINIKILINELKALEAHGIINRKVYAEVPSRVEYSLTKKGEDLAPLYNAIISFGKEYSNLKNKNEELDRLSNQYLSFGMGVITSKWSAPIVYSLFNKVRRFKDLERFIEGISTRMLVKELQQLEEKGIVFRTSFPEVPPRVEYELSSKGKALHKIYIELIAFTKKHPQ